MFDLSGRKALVVGVANDQSIAWGCAKALRQQGADLAITYLNKKAEAYVRPLAEQLEATIIEPLDVRNESEVDALFSKIEKEWGKLDIVLHSIAFCPQEDLHGRVCRLLKKGLFYSHGNLGLLVHRFDQARRTSDAEWRNMHYRIVLWLGKSRRVLQHHGPCEGCSRIGDEIRGG